MWQHQNKMTYKMFVYTFRIASRENSTFRKIQMTDYIHSKVKFNFNDDRYSFILHIKTVSYIKCRLFIKKNPIVSKNSD